MGVQFIIFCLLAFGVTTASHASEIPDGYLVHNKSSGTTTQFVGTLFDETDGVRTNHIYLNGIRMASVQDGRVNYYHGDHLGSVNVVTDKSGVKQHVLEYAPFGEVVKKLQPGTNMNIQGYLYSGKVSDDESGLIYYGARYYHPKLGRFITADPTILRSNDPQDLNRYAFCRNNPVNLIDRTGHGWLKKLFRKVQKVIEDAVQWLEEKLNVKIYIDAQFKHTYETDHPIADPIRIAGEAARDTAIQPWKILVGIKEWAAGEGVLWNPFTHEEITPSHFDDKFSALFINGILTTLDAAEISAKDRRAALFYNPTHGALADLTEAILQKFLFTSSIDRQLAGIIGNLREPKRLTGHSQGSLILRNSLMNVGFRRRHLPPGSDAVFLGTQLSQPSVFLSAGMANSTVYKYEVNFLDPSSLGGPNLNPVSLLGGGLGAIAAPFRGVPEHGIDAYGIY